MPRRNNTGKALFTLKAAQEKLSNIHLPDSVELSGQSPFEVDPVNCSDCGVTPHVEEMQGDWLAECTQCTSATQTTYDARWKAILVWNQLHAKTVNYAS